MTLEWTRRTPSRSSPISSTSAYLAFPFAPSARPSSPVLIFPCPPPPPYASYVKIGLAYIQLVRYFAVMDPIFDGKPRALTHLDVLAAFEPLIHAPGSSTKIFYNGELGIKEGNDLISDGKIDVGGLWAPFYQQP